MTDKIQRNGKSEKEKPGRLESARESAAEAVGGTAAAVRRRSDSAVDLLERHTKAIEENFKDKTEDAADAARELLEKSRTAARSAADGLDKTADHIREADLDDLKQKASEGVREHPGMVAVSAGITGLLIGYLLGKKLG